MKIKTFTIDAYTLYKVSKPTFYGFINDCEISIVFDCTQMQFCLKQVARYGQKKQRVETMALIMAYASIEHTERLKTWFMDYFAPDVRKELFDLDIDDTDRSFIYGKQLAKAIIKLKRKRL